MKKSLILLTVFLLGGCATYRFQKPDDSATAGYLAYYDGKPLAEYTVGKDKSLPDLKIAKERFKRRRLEVERYYKQTGQIESRFRAYLLDPPEMLAGFLWGILRWPYTAISDYRYHHNAAYRDKVDKLDEQQDAFEEARQKSLKKELDAYIAKDLAEESGGPGVIDKTLQESEMLSQMPPSASEPAVTQEQVAAPAVVLAVPSPLPVEETAAVQAQASPLAAAAVEPSARQTPLPKEKPARKPKPEPKPRAPKASRPAKVLGPLKAVIWAHPLKGSSPLVVKFSAAKSTSPGSRIVAYAWDFGDGDTSVKKTPQNTYWSTTYGSRFYTVTLSVRNQEGTTASTSATIEVITN